ncbi:MAG: 3-hydroxyacyl-CoA dehydrogenase family protein [Acidimicrobiia bacterium]
MRTVVSNGSTSKVAVLGAGLMGAAVAAEYLAAGYSVTVTTSARTSPEEALARVREHLAGPAGELTWAGSPEKAAAGARLVVECLPEDAQLKHAHLRAAQQVAADALLCTNTSSLPLEALAEALNDPTRLVGTHYLNPPWAFRVVELVIGDRSDPQVVEEVESVLRHMGKMPVRVRDVPGFVINRLQFSLLREAINLVEESIVTPADLDRIVTDGLGRRWSVLGPFATIELGGPELFRGVAEWLWPRLSCRHDPPDHWRFLGLSPAELEAMRQERERGLFG